MPEESSNARPSVFTLEFKDPTPALDIFLNNKIHETVFCSWDHREILQNIQITKLVIGWQKIKLNLTTGEWENDSVGEQDKYSHLHSLPKLAGSSKFSTLRQSK